MSIKSFLYRRLSNFITCEFAISKNSKISLSNKYEIASFQDVFCHPFYWQVFNYIDKPVNLIVDCGAHCGHFTILVDICLKSKFGSNYKKNDYVLIEPNPRLISTIAKNIKNFGLEDCVDIHQGLLGINSGESMLWVNPKNYLSASLNSKKGLIPFNARYIDLSNIVKGKVIDIIKIDIEGGEFDFVDFNLDLFSQIRVIFIELHQDSLAKHKKLLDSLRSIGFYEMNSTNSGSHKLIIFKNSLM